jgi:hypothetical protein
MCMRTFNCARMTQYILLVHHAFSSVDCCLRCILHGKGFKELNLVRDTLKFNHDQ